MAPQHQVDISAQSDVRSTQSCLFAQVSSHIKLHSPQELGLGVTLNNPLLLPLASIVSSPLFSESRLAIYLNIIQWHNNTL